MIDAKPKDVRYVKSQIALLEEKKLAELREHGKVMNGTLARYKRNQAMLNLYSGDVEEAEKNVILSFSYLKSSYQEAIEIQDSEFRNKITHNISLDQNKLINLYTSVRLSVRSSVSVDLLRSIYTNLSTLIIGPLIKHKENLWLDIILRLSSEIKKEKFDFVDDDETVHFIEKEITPTLIIDDAAYAEIQWLIIRVYQAVLKRDRQKANGDSEISKRLATYRRESANRLYGLGEIDGAVEDLSESYLYEILASNNLIEWNRSTKKYSLEFAKVVEKYPNKSRFMNYIYVRVYTKGFNLSIKASDRYENICKAVDYAESLGGIQEQYLLPHKYLSELLLWLQSAKDCSSIINNIKKSHQKLKSELYLTDPTAQAYQLYISTISLLRGEYVSCGITVLDSVYELINSKVIKNDEHIFLELILRAISKLVNIQIDQIEESEAGIINNENAFYELEKHLANEEGCDIEVKLSDSVLEKIAESVCGLANNKGGKVIIGLVEKDRFHKRFPDKEIANYRIVAQNFVLIGHKSFDIFRQKLAAHLKAKANLYGLDLNDIYNPTILNIDSKSILLINVRPVFRERRIMITLDGKAYGRYDNQTTIMKSDEIVSRMMNQSQLA